jgi:hypothetical protein
MYMRFRAQYWDDAEHVWLPVAGVAASPWVYAGSARYRASQAGWTFQFAQPEQDTSFTLRGVVDYQWRALVRPRARGRAREARRRHARRRHRARRHHRRHRHHRRAHRRHRRAHRHHGRAHRHRHAHRRRAVPAAHATWRVVANRHLVTLSGIPGVKGGDPEGTSKALCLLW